jgi:hypothetical protein
MSINKPRLYSFKREDACANHLLVFLIVYLNDKTRLGAMELKPSRPLRPPVPLVKQQIGVRKKKPGSCENI